MLKRTEDETRLQLQNYVANSKLDKGKLEDKSAAPIIKYLEEGILPTEKRREKEIIYTKELTDKDT